MSRIYVVPLVAQTSSDTCWNASAQMIWFYWQGVTHRQGPMNSLSITYSNNLPILPSQFIDLANKVGMKEIDQKYGYYTSSVLEGLLKQYGPLWCAGYWYGVGHIIVLTGVDGETIYFNDPDGGVKKTDKVNWFNDHLATDVDGCMMYKDPNAY